MALRNRSGRFILVVFALAALASCTSSGGPAGGSQRELVLAPVAGTDQAGVVGTELAQPLRVRLTDSSGAALAGKLVTFRVTSGDGRASSSSSLADSDGVAEARWALGTKVSEAQRLEASVVDSVTGTTMAAVTFSATPLPDAPASLQVHSGDQQEALAGDALALPCVVALADQYGNPTPGASIDWGVTEGGGAVSLGLTAVDANGRASASWKLGATEGAQSLQAVVAGLDVSFQAIGLPGGLVLGPAGSIVRVEGDGQTAAPGAPVAVAPVVAVLDVVRRPVVGAEVAFAITAGGGAVESPTARTDASGRASCGRWTLGARGINALRASVAGLRPVTFSATAANTSPDVSVSVLEPTAGQTVGDLVDVAATITSTYQLAKVTASVGQVSQELVYGPYGQSGSAWIGYLSMRDQPSGAAGIVVTATDVRANTTEAVVPVLLDHAPVVTVSAPIEVSVARPRLKLAATCKDDGAHGCRSLSAMVTRGTVLARGVDHLSTEIDLSDYEGRYVPLLIVGQDWTGHRTTVTRTVCVESSAQLATRAEVNGPVWDVSGARILFVDLTGDSPSLALRDTSGGTTEWLERSPDLNGGWGDYGFITTAGAIYAYGNTDHPWPFCSLYEWRQGARAVLANLDSCMSLRAAGNWAIYSATETSQGPVTMWRRDLGAGASTLLTAAAGNWMNDVASNGDIVYWTYSDGAEGYNIHRWRAGVDAALTSDPYPMRNTYPLTDGVNVVYRKDTCCASSAFQLAAHDGTREALLGPATSAEPWPGRQYAVAGGYIAYAAEDAGGLMQIFRRGPAGEEQLTQFESTIDAIAPDGTAVLTRTSDGRRFLASPPAALREIGSSLGQVIYRDGHFLVLLGRAVLEVK